MKTILLCLLVASSCWAQQITVRLDGTTTIAPGRTVPGPLPQPAPQPNPAYARYWWLYSIAQRYGLTLPCDIAQLRLAMYAATTPENTAGIALDAADAIACFFGNGGTAADWSVVPPETIQ